MGSKCLLKNACSHMSCTVTSRHTPVRCFLLAVAAALAACSTQISALNAATGHSAKVPKSPYVYVYAGTTLRAATRITLLPGMYKPVGKNEQGVWYAGSKRNVQIFYTDTKRSDGKRLLAAYAGGVLLPLKPGNPPSLFIVPSTEKLTLVSASSDSEDAAAAGMTAGQIQAEAATNARAEYRGGPAMVGAAVGGVIADGLMDYDAKGLRLMPQLVDAPGVASWLDGS